MAGRFGRFARMALRLSKRAAPRVSKAVEIGAISSASGLGIEQLLKGSGLVSRRIFTSPGVGGGGRRRVFKSPGLSRGGGRRRRQR